MKETAVGCVSKESETFIKSCNGSGFREPTTTLFATNLEVDSFNTAKLQELPGPLHVYESVDTGPKKLLDKINTPKVLIN